MLVHEFLINICISSIATSSAMQTHSVFTNSLTNDRRMLRITFMDLLYYTFISFRNICLEGEIYVFHNRAHSTKRPLYFSLLLYGCLILS